MTWGGEGLAGGTGLTAGVSRLNSQLDERQEAWSEHLVDSFSPEGVCRWSTPRERSPRPNSMTVTKHSLIEALHEALGLNRREVKSLLDVFFGELGSTLESGESIKLAGFGTVALRDKSVRPKRNPRTGEGVAARRVVTFRPARTSKLRATQGR